MRQRRNGRQGIVQLVRDDADHFLPRRHFLRIDLARELLEQQQPVRLGVQKEPPLRHVIDLRFAGQLEREQRVAAAFDGLAQRRGRDGEITRKTFAFELAALAEELARGRVAVEHGIAVVGEHQRERRGLYDRVEHELALVQALPFDAQAVAQAVIGVHELAHLVARGTGDAHAEIAVLDAGDAVGERPRHAAPARREHGAGPGDERREHQRRDDGRHPGRVDEVVRDHVRRPGSAGRCRRARAWPSRPWTLSGMASALSSTIRLLARRLATGTGIP